MGKYFNKINSRNELQAQQFGSGDWSTSCCPKSFQFMSISQFTNEFINYIFNYAKMRFGIVFPAKRALIKLHAEALSSYAEIAI